MTEEDYWGESLTQTIDHFNCSNLIETAKESRKRLKEEDELKLLNYAIKYKKCAKLIEYAYAINCKLPEEMHNFIIMQDSHVSLSYFKLLNKLKANLENMASIYNKDMTLEQLIATL